MKTLQVNKQLVQGLRKDTGSEQGDENEAVESNQSYALALWGLIRASSVAVAITDSCSSDLMLALGCFS